MSDCPKFKHFFENNFIEKKKKKDNMINVPYFSCRFKTEKS